MKIFNRANLILLTILSVTSGVAKITKMPQEMEFFGSAGFSDSTIVLFGATQLIGGALLVLKKTRASGATVVALTFGVSTVIIFMGGKIPFGVFSLLPIVMAALVVKECAQVKSQNLETS